MLTWITDREQLQKTAAEHADYFVLAFWGSFSDAAQRALHEWTEFSDQYEGVSRFSPRHATSDRPSLGAHCGCNL